MAFNTDTVSIDDDLVEIEIDSAASDVSIPSTTENFLLYNCYLFIEVIHKKFYTIITNKYLART